MRRNEVDEHGNIRRTASRPKAKRFTAETVSDRELLNIGILHLWRKSIEWSFFEWPRQEMIDWIPRAIRIWEEQSDASVQYSMAQAFAHLAASVDKMRPSDPFYETSQPWRLIMTHVPLVMVLFYRADR